MIKEIAETYKKPARPGAKNERTTPGKLKKSKMWHLTNEDKKEANGNCREWEKNEYRPIRRKMYREERCHKKITRVVVESHEVQIRHTEQEQEKYVSE